MIVEAETLDSKTPNETVDIEFEFARLLETTWRPGAEYALDDEVRPPTPNGVQYKVTTAGQSGIDEPVWLAIAVTVSDGLGALVWTGVAISSGASDSISSQSASADSDLTIGTLTRSGTVVTVPVSGGVDGTEYSITCQVVTAGGQTHEQRVFLPVEHQRKC